MLMKRTSTRSSSSNNEDEDCAISTSTRNYPTHGTCVTFDDDSDIIELANYLAEVIFSDSDQEPTSHWQPEYVFSFDRWQLVTPKVEKEILLERAKRSFLPMCVKWKRLSIKSLVVVESLRTRRKAKASPFLCVSLVVSLSLSLISRAFISTFPTKATLLLTSRVNLPDRTLKIQQCHSCKSQSTHTRYFLPTSTGYRILFF